MMDSDEHPSARIKRIAQALYDTPDLAVTDMRVDELDGVVAVQGRVASAEQRSLVLEAVARMPDARSIEVRVKIDPRDSVHGDAQISVAAGPGSHADIGPEG